MIDKFIQDIALHAGKITLKYFKNTEIAYTKKDALDVVTHADLAVNSYLIEQIQKKFPDHKIISEESATLNPNVHSSWIIDPLDGTLNFSRGIPVYCILIAHATNNQIDYGVVFDPVHDDLYYAARNKGAYLNNKLIKTSPKKTIENTVGLINSRIDKSNLHVIKKLNSKPLINKITLMSINCLGLSAVQVAAGKRDWFISTGAGGDWDYAAGKIILEESGCKVTNIENRPWELGDKTMVSANPYLHKKLISAIK